MKLLIIPLEPAMVSLAIAAAIWAAALLLALPWERDKLQRGAIVAVALVILGLIFGPALTLTYDSTVDLALGQHCLAGECTALGVGASHGDFEGGVLWDWILAAVFALSPSPRSLELVVLIAHAIGAGAVASLPDDWRIGAGSAAIYFAVSFGLAPGYIAFHPTLAPAAILPAVLLATGRFAEGEDEGRLIYARALLLGASYGVGLGVYIAALLLGALLGLGVLRGRLGELVAVGVGFGAEQLLVTPDAARNNFNAIGPESITIGLVLLGLLGALLVARRWIPAGIQRYPASVALGLVCATFVVGALVAGHEIWPFYVALCAAMLAGAWAELAAMEGRWPRVLRRAIAGAVVALTVVCSIFYSRAAGSFHEGLYRYRDIHELGAHFHRGHGVAVSSPSYAVYHALFLWAREDPPEPGRGVALWRTDEPGPGICVPGTEQLAGQLRMCEYEAWARTAGARKCPALLDELDPDACELVGDPGDFELTLLNSPIHYPESEESGEIDESGPPFAASFQVEVCARGGGDRILEPVVFPAYPLRPRLEIRAPAWAELLASGEGVRVSEGGCGVLEWEWAGGGEPLVAWARDHVPAENFDYLVFFVRERAAD